MVGANAVLVKRRKGNMDKQDKPDRQCCSESTVAENHEESFCSREAIPKEYDTWHMLIKEDPGAQSLGRQPREEPNQMLGNDRGDETLQRSELILLPKLEMKYEPEDEMNEEEDPEECDAETSNVLSGSNVMNFPWNMNIPHGSHDSGTHLSSKNTLTYGNKQATEGFDSFKMMNKRERDVRNMNEEIFEIASGTAFKMLKTESNKESVSQENQNEVMNAEGEGECRDIIEKEGKSQEEEVSHIREGQRSSLLHAYSMQDETAKNRDSRCCEICGKCFQKSSDLKRHNRVHAGERPLNCPVCKESFLEKATLIAHIVGFAHEGDFKCSECNASFTDKDDLVAHMLVHTREGHFKCSVCGKAFNRMNSLNSHEMLHSGEKHFNCHVCKKMFSQKMSLINHMRTHAGEKPFKCGTCGTAFAQSGDLTVHMRVHSPFKCIHCDEAFTCCSQLTAHMRRHTHERPFVCAVCGKRFRYSESCSYHTRYEHAAATTSS